MEVIGKKHIFAQDNNYKTKLSMKRIFRKVLLLASALLFSIAGNSCSSSDNGGALAPGGQGSGTGGQGSGGQEETVFAKGADVSWVTEMEANGKKFYDAKGNEMECMALMKSLGMNAIRLRVWVNPKNKWNGKDDVLKKAERAKNLGMRLMIDFHYSDYWADPAKQSVPKAWKDYNFTKMKQAVADHTKDVLSALKAKGIDVEWVQVGNETTDGMLWGENTSSDDDHPVYGKESDAVTGRASRNMANFAGYVTAGYDAVKSVYPKAKVVVHLDKGNNLDQYTWLFNGLKKNGGKWDVIGMSLYPYWVLESDKSKTWQQITDACLSNIKTLSAQYNCDVVVSEIGEKWNSDYAAAFLKKAIDGCKAIPTCEGVFYWEPECNPGWNNYQLGAFDNSGKPMPSLDAFK